MASKTEIVSYALILIGETGIESLYEGSKKADIASSLYPLSLDEFLAEYEWSFATKRRNLSLESEDNDGDFPYAFYLPDDYIRIIDIDFDRNAEYRIENGLLYYGGSTATLRYVFRQEDLNKFHPKALVAFAYNLASKMIYPLFRGSQDLAVMEQKYLIALEKAKQFDGGTYIGINNSTETEDMVDWQNM